MGSPQLPRREGPRVKYGVPGTKVWCPRNYGVAGNPPRRTAGAPLNRACPALRLVVNTCERHVFSGNF